MFGPLTWKEFLMCVLLAAMAVWCIGFCSGCTQEIVNYELYDEFGDKIIDAHYGKTSFCSWTVKTGITGQADKTGIRVGAKSSSQKPDPESIEATGGAAGTIVKEIIRTP